ncbi:MAG: 30S ribosomal protein S3 [Candidatus Magasanikbacteria bacterium RIFOXYA2_FULL_44_8]|uniref:Small ribosomal subunit protein uS3 n=1 Tax=Candidatus Magasanikbacteria bacterium RIFOXYA2_FULL_44_8 TaxID=1798696 RepID=A0A1F6NJT7_9BACT|nr:MAG: 30S ribosomal protein S3 [Candidatus Magasanikbacteria bacterium RIFOXYA2_FULL_44_8]
MGHKVHPIIHRTPFIFNWDSRWYAKGKEMPQFLKQEVAVRKLIAKKFKEAGVDAVSIERTPKEVVVTICAAKPGVIIGRSGQGLEEVRKDIEKKILQFKSKVKINVQAVKQPALSAHVMAQSVADEIERRIAFRRVMKQTIEKVMAAGAQGVKIKMSGRLNGAEIARSEVLGAGKMSLITMRSHVDYALVEASTIYGKIGVKVWIYLGEAFGRRDKFEKKEEGDKESPAKRKVN